MVKGKRLRFYLTKQLFHHSSCVLWVKKTAFPIFKYKEKVREQKKLEEKCFMLFLNPDHAELQHQEFEKSADQRHLQNLGLELISFGGRCEIF